jgi:hypothetical protein
MKKLVLIGALALSLAGCGEETTSDLMQRCMQSECSAKDQALLNQALGPDDPQPCERGQYRDGSCR